LLFLGAGAIISRLHTHDMEKMGALAKRMPWTAAACLIGCLAISAIPPLNGFISEWYTWQSLFSLSRVEAVALQLAGPIAMVMLAVTGGLAVMCFVKMYGITFCGAPRSTHAEEAQEVPNTMIVAMLLLAALCVFIALSASWLAPKIMHIAHAFTNTPPVTVTSGIALVPGTFHTRVTPSLLLLLLLAMPLLPGLYWLWCRSRRAAFRRTGDAWACGYGWEHAMAPSGNGVMQPLRVVFCALFRLRQQLDPTLRLNKGLAHVTARAQSTEPFWDERVIRPIVSATQRLAKEIQHLQSGDFRLYCLYVVAALVVLLIAIAV
ncbi:TPA: proton-conducting transporter membrane subunit, partial [Escherichia coli]